MHTFPIERRAPSASTSYSITCQRFYLDDAAAQAAFDRLFDQVYEHLLRRPGCLTPGNALSRWATTRRAPECLRVGFVFPRITDGGRRRDAHLASCHERGCFTTHGVLAHVLEGAVWRGDAADGKLYLSRAARYPAGPTVPRWLARSAGRDREAINQQDSSGRRWLRCAQHAKAAGAAVSWPQMRKEAVRRSAERYIAHSGLIDSPPYTKVAKSQGALVILWARFFVKTATFRYRVKGDFFAGRAGGQRPRDWRLERPVIQEIFTGSPRRSRYSIVRSDPVACSPPPARRHAPGRRHSAHDGTATDAAIAVPGCFAGSCAPSMPFWASNATLLHPVAQPRFCKILVM